MTHKEFMHILNSLNGLTPDQMQHLQRELASKIAVTRPRPDTGLGSLGAMRDAADELDQIVEQAMKNRRERPMRLAPGE